MLEGEDPQRIPSRVMIDRTIAYYAQLRAAAAERIASRPKVLILNRRETSGGEWLGRPHALGNPYQIGEHGTRGEVVELYRAWLTDQLRTNRGGPAARALLALRRRYQAGETLELACVCHPRPCHLHVVRDLILQREPLFPVS